MPKDVAIRISVQDYKEKIFYTVAVGPFFQSFDSMEEVFPFIEKRAKEVMDRDEVAGKLRKDVAATKLRPRR
jgi:hypothetical protein